MSQRIFKKLMGLKFIDFFLYEYVNPQLLISKQLPAKDEKIVKLFCKLKCACYIVQWEQSLFLKSDRSRFNSNTLAFGFSCMPADDKCCVEVFYCSFNLFMKLQMMLNTFYVLFATSHIFFS